MVKRPISTCVGLVVVATATPGCSREVSINLLETGALQASPPTSSTSPGTLLTSSTTDAGSPQLPSPTPGEPESDAPVIDSGVDREPATDATGPDETTSDPQQEPVAVEEPEPAPMLADAGASDAGTERGPLTPIHYYDFSGEGSIVYDRVGDADGELLGGALLDGMGGVVLDGVDDYVELPPGLISGLPTATFVAWLEWGGGDCWQRVFDFGSLVVSDDGVTSAQTSVFLTPSSCRYAHFDVVDESVVSAEFHVGSSVYFTQGAEFPSGALTFAGLVVDPERGLEIVVDGQIVAQAPAPLTLDNIEDANSWLGKSLWSVDAMLLGRYDEFMIFDVALSPEQLQALYLQSRPGGDAAVPTIELN